MTVGFFSASAVNIDAVFTAIRTALTGQGWTAYDLNTSSAEPGSNLLGRETVFQAPGINGATTYTAAPQVVGFARFLGNTGFRSATRGILIYAGSGIRAPATITNAARAGTTVTITTSAAHGFSVNDPVLVNGMTGTAAALNSGSSLSNVTLPTGPRIASTPSSTTFTYTDVNTGTITSVATGGTAIILFNVTGGRAVNVAGPFNDIVIPLDSTATVIGYCDAQRICGLIAQGGGYQPWFAGCTGRDHVPPDFADTAFVTGALTASGSTVTATLDRNVTNIQPGQPIWVIDQASNTYERTTVDATQPTGPTTTIKFTSLTNSYSAGAFVGEDPMPLFIQGRNSATIATTDHAADTYYGAWQIDATRTNPTSTTAVPIIDEAVLYTDQNPDAAGYYQGRDLFLKTDSAPKCWRGRRGGSVVFPIGSQVDNDIMRCGRNDTVNHSTDYKIITTQKMNTNWAMAFGPGAT